MKPGKPASAPTIEGASERQVYHWIERGYLRVDRPGTGNRREWPDEEIRVARLMARLTNGAGLPPALAHAVAREARYEDTFRLAPGLVLLIEDVPGAPSADAGRSTPDGSKGGDALITGSSVPAVPAPSECPTCKGEQIVPNVAPLRNMVPCPDCTCDRCGVTVYTSPGPSLCNDCADDLGDRAYERGRDR